MAEGDQTTSKISFSPDLAPREGERRVTEEEAVELLMRRFGIRRAAGTTGQVLNRIGQGTDLLNPFSRRAEGDNNAIRPAAETDPTGEYLVTNLVKLLPQEAWTPSVLMNIDFRPVLSELIMTEHQASRTRALHYVNDVPFTPATRVKAGELLVSEQDRIAELAEAAAPAYADEFAQSPDPAAARRAWIEQQVNGWRMDRKEGEGGLGALPSLLLEAQETEAGSTARDTIEAQVGRSGLYENLLGAAGDIGAQVAKYDWMSEDYIQWMFRMNMVEWDQMLTDERNKIDARAAGLTDVPADFQVDTGGLLPGQGPVRREDIRMGGNVGSATTQGGTRMRLLDVFNMPFSSKRTTQELQNLQDKLIAGGYLDEDDVRYWGRATDDATMKAWHTLVRDSINLGQDMMTVLKESTLAKAAKDEDESKKAQRDLVLSSTVGLQTTADALGQQVLGRKLSADQHARIVEFIHQMEREQHSTVEQEGSQEVEAIDVEAEVARWVEAQNPVEAGAYDLLEQFQVFNQIARRPG